MISLRTKAGEAVCELGGGANPLVRPNIDFRFCYDEQGNPTVDFTADFEEPLPMKDCEWDGVFQRFCLEHITYLKVPSFLSEVFRILKPGGKFVCVTANTEAQIKWIQNNPQGWDGKNIFESASCVLYGTLDYPQNSHKSYFSPIILRELFTNAGFTPVTIQPYGARDTDLVIEAVRPVSNNKEVDNMIHSVSTDKVTNLSTLAAQAQTPTPNITQTMSREEMFDKHYFNGGGKVGGYAREGYRDFHQHFITFQHILYRRPESVLELGCSRGYVLKRLQDAGISGNGMEISKHCLMTRVCDGITQWDMCNTPWPFQDQEFDLVYSQAVLEHIPKDYLTSVLLEMRRVAKRGLHGIDFGQKDDGFDKTHVSLFDKNFWEELFSKHGVEAEIVDKEYLEQGNLPADYFSGDGKLKLNLGSFTNMFSHGWQNLDIVDLTQFANANRYNFLKCDLRNGFPHATGSVDYVFMSHVLEHFDYQDGIKILRDIRRVIKPNGCVRIIVPDAYLLSSKYFKNMDDAYPRELSHYDEISDGCAARNTAAGKLWELLHAGHLAAYDYETLSESLKESGFHCMPGEFRDVYNGDSQKSYPNFWQVAKETTEISYDLSLFTWAYPIIG